MKIREVADTLELESIVGSLDVSFEGAYASDLLSDVMAHARDGDALITIQAHTNTVAVASHVGSPLVIVCNNRPIPDEMRDAATENSIVVVRTPLDQFTVSGRLYALLR